MDGKLYVETVIAGFAAGHEAKIPLIIGGNSNEGQPDPPDRGGVRRPCRSIARPRS
jgi:hypothetical protein